MELSSEDIRKVMIYYDELRKKHRETNGQIPHAKNIYIRCICCGTKLESIYEDDYPANQCMWNESSVYIVTPGFGSRYDMTELLIGLCDNCIDKAREENKIPWEFNSIDVPQELEDAYRKKELD